MQTIEAIRKQLQDRNLRAVSRLTGVGYATILRLMRGATPSYAALKKLSDYLGDRVD
jgi:transcriptional regulator with XRE-family HTH domain